MLAVPILKARALAARSGVKLKNIQMNQQEFVHAFQGYGLKVKDVRNDASLGRLDTKNIDFNADGYVTGGRELGALYSEIGRVSGAQRGTSVDLVRDGKRTAAADMVNAVDANAHDATYLTPKHRALRVAGYATMGLGIASLALAGAVGLAPAVLLFPIGSLLALSGGARPVQD